MFFIPAYFLDCFALLAMTGEECFVLYLNLRYTLILFEKPPVASVYFVKENA